MTRSRFHGRAAMTRGTGFALALALALGGCDRSATPAAERPAAPAALRATVVLEPARLEVGETAVVEVAFVTPPGWSVPPAPAPSAIEGIWLLDAERPIVVQEPQRWVHRNRFRVRARTPGAFEWPATTLEAAGPDGTREQLTAGPRRFEVVAVAPDLPDGQGFLSYLRPPARPPTTSPWIAGAVGAAFALAGVALVALVRRVRRDEDAGSAAEPGEGAPWRATQASLETARAIAESDPVDAADRASEAVRLYVARRFDAHDVLAATTPELKMREAPFLLTTRWEPLLRVLTELDDVRFLPVRDADAMRRASLSAIEEAQRLVVDMSPRGNTR